MIELQYGGSWYFTWTVAPSDIDIGDKAAEEGGGGECTAEEIEGTSKITPAHPTWIIIPHTWHVLNHGWVRRRRGTSLRVCRRWRLYEEIDDKQTSVVKCHHKVN